VFNSYVMKLNGKAQTTETLAYGSKVYIPVTELTKLTGASVKKTGNTYDITPINKEELKIMVRIMAFYNRLDGKLDGPNLISSYIHQSFDDIKYNDSVAELNRTIGKYNTLVKYREDSTFEINDLVKPSAAQGYNMKEDEKYFSSILSDYDQSLVYISNALDDLKNYYQTGNQKYETNYVNNLNKGLDYSYKGKEKARSRYDFYLNAINKK
jgi:type II secretory pathway component GspD/PulD (secretin)